MSRGFRGPSVPLGDVAKSSHEVPDGGMLDSNKQFPHQAVWWIGLLWHVDIATLLGPGSCASMYVQ
jgi:hypothetical protein